MAQTRTRRGAAFKARVALAAAKEDRTVPALVKEFGVHASQVQKWKRQLLERAAELFADGRSRREEDQVAQAELYAEIGRLQMELSWLKKKSAQLD
jgi:transposase-like protein